MAYERKCKLCQKEYRYCPHCEEFKHEPKWKFMFHDENCNTIFNTLQLHYQKKYTDDEAIKILKSCDLSVLKNATDAIRKQVQDILDKEIKEEPKEEVRTTARKVVKKVNENN